MQTYFNAIFSLVLFLDFAITASVAQCPLECIRDKENKIPNRKCVDCNIHSVSAGGVQNPDHVRYGYPDDISVLVHRKIYVKDSNAKDPLKNINAIELTIPVDTYPENDDFELPPTKQFYHNSKYKNIEMQRTKERIPIVTKYMKPVNLDKNQVIDV